MTSAAPRTFDLRGPLPQGRCVLEASAGTGKTYAIAALVCRFVAEQGVPLRELLVVTFTRAATSELRGRVRERLVGAARHLRACVTAGPVATDDPVLAHLADADQATCQTRLDRLTRALEEFDAATISTIHGFCQQVLGGLGLVADLDRGAQLLEDASEVIDEVVDDLLVRHFRDREPPCTRAQLRDLVAAVVGNPDAAIVPEDADPDDEVAAVRVALAHEGRDEVDRRKRERGSLSYEDLLTRLRDALRDPTRGEQAAAQLRARYRIALIDEFQDTDPVQWEILRRAFTHDDATLVLIGDPKQAIYSFRGADIHAYLAAAREAQRQTLSTSWRADAGLLDALDHLLTGATFGHPEIAFRSVQPAPGHVEPRLTGAPGDGPLRLRVAKAAVFPGSGKPNAATIRSHLAADVAAETTRLLAARPRINRADHDPRPRHAIPGDIAILVRSNAEGRLIHRVLRDQGIPAIINGVGSVFGTTAADHWLRLLAALERPGAGSRVRALTLSPFLGWDGDTLAAADEDDLARVHDQVAHWRSVLADHGVATLWRTIDEQTALTSRLLGTAGGDRDRTDLQHIAELLHQAATAEGLGPAALSGWLREHIAEADDEGVAPDARARRLESDQDAVQVLTIHRSKGLEYPIVLVPFLYATGRLGDSVPLVHDPDRGGRVAAVGGPTAPGHDQMVEASRDEQIGEQLRLLYVAVTRAQHHVVLWWSPHGNQCGNAPLTRILFGRDDDGRLDTSRLATGPTDRRLPRQLGWIDAQRGIALEWVPSDPTPVAWRPAEADERLLTAAPFERTIDLAWSRTSYSALTRGDRDDRAQVGSEPEASVTEDEHEPVSQAATDVVASTLQEIELQGHELPLATMPGGAAVGTLVHDLLEHVELTADDLPAALMQVLAQRRDRHAVTVDDDQLVHGLAAAIATPLGPHADGRALRDFAPTDRLAELDFELPLAGPGRAVTVGAIGDALAGALRATSLDGYRDALQAPTFHRAARGFLTGSIDLVLRLTRPDSPPRFLVVDHKTNVTRWPPEPTLTAWDYRPQALAEAMMHGHYPLQALLYQVALHRYLRWRMPDYDPTVHLGGCLYLFLRGMTGPGTPQVDGTPCGVFAWRPPADLITDVSDLLDRGTAT